MHIGDTVFAGGAIAQVSHIDFADEWSILPFHAAIFCQCNFLSGFVKNFANRTRAQTPFAENVFIARCGVEIYAPNAGCFLSAVVLLLHQQVELIEPILRSAVFIFIMLKWL